MYNPNSKRNTKRKRPSYRQKYILGSGGLYDTLYIFMYISSYRSNTPSSSVYDFQYGIEI